MWAGPHHLHFTSLPDWTQSLGMVFSIMLLAPSWGGVVNGIMTLSGAWDKLRTDPIIRFLILSLVFYGMATLEGPILGIKTVNALSHNTDWTIAHVHSGTLGWVSMITIRSLYVLVPKLFNQEAMYSQKLIFLHFWLSLIGTLLYTSSLWIAGVMQGLMWRALDPDGTLIYSFIDAVNATHWFYVLRLMGGLIFLTGMLVMTLNVWRTLSKPTLNPKTVPLDPI